MKRLGIEIEIKSGERGYLSAEASGALRARVVVVAVEGGGWRSVIHYNVEVMVAGKTRCSAAKTLQEGAALRSLDLDLGAKRSILGRSVALFHVTGHDMSDPVVLPACTFGM